MEMTKEFILRQQEEKTKLERAPDICNLCKKEILLETDKNKPTGNGIWNARVYCAKVVMKRKP